MNKARKAYLRTVSSHFQEAVSWNRISGFLLSLRFPFLFASSLRLFLRSLFLSVSLSFVCSANSSFRQFDMSLAESISLTGDEKRKLTRMVSTRSSASFRSRSDDEVITDLDTQTTTDEESTLSTSFNGFSTFFVFTLPVSFYFFFLLQFLDDASSTTSATTVCSTTERKKNEEKKAAHQVEKIIIQEAFKVQSLSPLLSSAFSRRKHEPLREVIIDFFFWLLTFSFFFMLWLDCTRSRGIM